MCPLAVLSENSETKLPLPVAPGSDAAPLPPDSESKQSSRSS